LEELEARKILKRWWRPEFMKNKFKK
jgi:hypothetical protein